jgi:hypothetical protein
MFDLYFVNAIIAYSKYYNDINDYSRLNETEQSGFNSRHIEGPMRTPDSHRSTTTSDSLSDGFGQRFDDVIL